MLDIFTDLEGKHPAKTGDKVAMVVCRKSNATMIQESPDERPTLTDKGILLQEGQWMCSDKDCNGAFEDIWMI